MSKEHVDWYNRVNTQPRYLSLKNIPIAFAHIPKVCSSSISKLLEGIDPKPYPDYTLSLEQVKGKELVAIVRNPFNRAVSSYFAARHNKYVSDQDVVCFFESFTKNNNPNDLDVHYAPQTILIDSNLITKIFNIETDLEKINLFLDQYSIENIPRLNKRVDSDRILVENAIKNSSRCCILIREYFSNDFEVYS